MTISGIAMLIERGDGAGMVAGAPVYTSGEQTVGLAQADSEVRARVVGLVSANESSGHARICTSGTLHLTHRQWQAVQGKPDDPEHEGLPGLSGIGRPYYLDAWTPGRLTLTKPRLPGQWIVEVGTAVAALVLRIDIKPPILIPAWYPFELVAFDPTQIDESPWNRGQWDGQFVAVKNDGTPDDRFGAGGISLIANDVRPPGGPFETRSDYVERVLAHCDTGHDYTEFVAGIAALKDGRYVSWESSVDVTGSGFHADAYGGDADIFLSTTARGAWLAITEKGRDALRFATLPTEEAVTNVLHDRYLELRIEPSWTSIPAAQAEPATLQGRMAPDGSDNLGGAAVAGVVDAPLGTCYVKLTSGVSELWVRTHDGWRTAEAIQLTWVTERRRELVRLAAASGEFGDLVEPRVDELIKRWDAHYDEQQQSGG